MLLTKEQLTDMMLSENNDLINTALTALTYRKMLEKIIEARQFPASLDVAVGRAAELLKEVNNGNPLQEPK